METTTKRRILLWLAPGGALIIALAWLLRPDPIAVDLLAVERGPLEVAISEEGETRVRDVFVVSASVAGLMRRVELKAGDHVAANETIIARIEPSVPMFLDERAMAEAKANVDAAAAARKFAEAQGRRMQAELEFAESELRRLRALATRQSISQNELESAERRAKTAAAAVAEAQAAMRMRASEYEQARARLLNPAQAKRAAKDCDCVLVRSPVAGSVLRVLQESEAAIAAGTPILEIGDPRNLEIQVDLLSEDAVRVRPGQRVVVDSWGGSAPLRGTVRRIEPYGYTKVSALGIEEQRVNVIIDLLEPYETWRRLGHGYRVEPRIVVWESQDALSVPLSALFRQQDKWAVFVEKDGRAALRNVQIDHQNGSQVHIIKGLDIGERVVLHPNERIADRSRIRVRVGG
jgi:HlyD family secretion protein